MYLEGLDLRGRIMACPSKNNGNLFSAEWTVNETTVDSIWFLNMLEGRAEFKKELKLLIVENEARAAGPPSQVDF
jgi:hypothetical protein